MSSPHTSASSRPSAGRRRGARAARAALAAGLALGAVAGSVQRAAATPATVVDDPRSAAGAVPAAEAAIVPLASAVVVAANEAATVEAAIRASRVGIICPIAGTVQFFDDYGMARSGGRRHRGTDLANAYGTANVAVVDGLLAFKSGGLQGRGAYLTGADGNEYWYFHLSAYEGEPRFVRRGETVGYTGTSGNAGGPHTHFEIHPGADSDRVENPYPKLDFVCTDRAPL